MYIYIYEGASNPKLENPKQQPNDRSLAKRQEILVKKSTFNRFLCHHINEHSRIYWVHEHTSLR